MYNFWLIKEKPINFSLCDLISSVIKYTYPQNFDPVDPKEGHSNASLPTLISS